MNYKKSILSLAAVLALSSTINADPNATYLPLTNETNDNAWIMFGVNDFSSGVATAPATDGAFTAGFSQVTEASVADDIASPSPVIITAAAADTMFQDSTGNKNMATFQALKDSSGSPLITESLVMAIKTSDTTFTETQPIRSMYIAIEGAPTVAKIKLNYKATLEGKAIEIQFGGAGVVYKTTISETATFNSPAVAADTTAAVVETDQAAPADVLAYDLTASPVLASAYSKADHQGTSAGAERFYYYDSANAQWLLWDRAKIADGTNTITSFAKGKAYWGKMDINSDGATTSTTKAGLYLGKTGLAEADATIYTNNLTAGAWNMIAIDPASHPDMRNATTGLILNASAVVNTDDINITDETGVNSVTVTLNTVNSGATEEIAKQINETIEAAKVLGTVPDTFNIKAFDASPAAAPDTLMLFLSDKKFSLSNPGADGTWTLVKTLANENPVISVTGAVGAVADLNATDAAVSRYGEYSMLIEPLVGTDTASYLDNTKNGGLSAGTSTGSATVLFGNIDGDSKNGATTATPLALAADDAATTLSLAQAALELDDVFDNSVAGTDGVTPKGKVWEIDTNFDGTTDMLLAAANKSFYVKDNTFTRVYTVDTSANGLAGALSPINISPADEAVTPAGAAATDLESAINVVADSNATTSTGVYADIDPNDATKLVIVSKGSKVLELEDVDSATIDYFTNASSTSDIAKGAVKRVVDISKLVRQNLTLDSVKVAFTADADAEDHNVTITTVVGGTSVEAAPTDVAAAPANDTDRITMLDSLVANLNAALKAANSGASAAAFASHNYVSGLNDISKAIITIEGVDINNTVLNEANATALAATITDANAATEGTINVDGAVIVADLKSNAVYTPDYVNYGPLYTLKTAGYEAKAIIRASTYLNATPTTHWDHIDLTRSSKDWLKNNEFNLFSVDNSAGYWAYVDSFTPVNDIAEGTIVFTPSFVHHFNTRTGATENLLNAASFSVEITDTSATDGILDEETSNAKLLISGNEVQLTKTGTTFSAVLTAPETTGLTPNPGSNIAIGLKAADGLGESYTKSDLISFDYDEPAAPTVSFTNGATMAISDTSTDVASYYIWKDYIPDDGASLTPVASQLLAASAGAYNMCAQSTFGTTNSYKVIAFDGTGVFGKANASNITGITYVNTIKGSTVLTHSNGEATSTVVSYDSSCVANATATKSGVEVKAVQVGTIVVSYIAIAGTTNNKDDLPYTAFYELADGQTDVLQIDILPVYAGAAFYVEYNGALYSGTFPANQAAADASFSDAINLTTVTSANQSLD